MEIGPDPISAEPGLVVPAPLWRRLAAAAYDALLLAALWMVLAVLDVVVRATLGLPHEPHVLRALLLLSGLGFFGWFWTHGGSPGMRAWRLELRRTDGRRVGWPTACARYVFAWLAWLPAGLGVLWSAVDAQRRAWHDRASGTELVLRTADVSGRASPPAAP